MNLVDREGLDAYLQDDVIGRYLDDYGVPDDERLTCQRWLRDTPAKRYIYERLYGDLLKGDAAPARVLDVGGGLTALTRRLAALHDYELVDLLAHEKDRVLADQMMAEAGRPFLHVCDWLQVDNEKHYDIVIANDLLPNVDQRLELFLEHFLHRTARLRLSLTYYDTSRYYLTRRIDADEIFCMLAWDHRQLAQVLRRFEERIIGADFEVFEHAGESVYENGRQVCLLEMKGGLR